MDNSKNEETTNSDSTEPIISWSGVQGETQAQEVDLPNAEELGADEMKVETPVEGTEAPKQ